MLVRTYYTRFEGKRKGFAARGPSATPIISIFFFNFSPSQKERGYHCQGDSQGPIFLFLEEGWGKKKNKRYFHQKPSTDLHYQKETSSFVPNPQQCHFAFFKDDEKTVPQY
jgi:hypothetical protein